jgi:DNA polymerase
VSVAPPPPPKPHATLDIETYSEAGLFLRDGKYVSMHGSTSKGDKGLAGVGTENYARHPTTEVLTLSYRLPGGPIQRWRPGLPLPQDLFDWLASGGLLEAHNVMFERMIWTHVCVPKYGFPQLPVVQLRCSMAKARVNAFPGALGALTEVLATPVVKDKDGRRLLDKFSVPRKPTKTDPRLRIRPEDDPEDAERLYHYCDVDVESEELVSAAMPDMSPAELAFWQIDQEINWRGVGVDIESVRAMRRILELALATYGEEFAAITGGLSPSQPAASIGWLAAKGVHMSSFDKDAVEEALKRPDLPDDARRVLEIRQLTGSASVKKLYSLEREATADARLKNLFVHHGGRTGRAAGNGPQPQNLPKAGPDLKWCECGQPTGAHQDTCAWCYTPLTGKVYGWDEPPPEGACNPVDAVTDIMKTGSLEVVEWFYGDALLAITGCIRGMFVAGPGMDLIASDFTAIEAVVAACLAGELWRIDVFKEGRPIYLESASRITGTSVEAYLAYAKENGKHHPDRNKIGKVAELALGFGGWIGGWRGFDDTDTFTDDQVKQNIIAWRNASPAIVEMWGGQGRGFPGSRSYRKEYYGLEGIFVQAVLYPGHTFHYRAISAYMKGDALVLRLPSGREMVYQSPRLTPSPRREGEYAITYMTWNTNPKYGPVNKWVPMSTYSGKIFENVVQATAHDILREAIIRLRAAGYPCVLHVHDEIVVEVPEGWGSVEEMERIMAERPAWAADWPIAVDGGYRAKRYRK